MTFGDMYEYRCHECDFIQKGYSYAPTLFMAEWHILDLSHYIGEFEKKVLDENWNPKLVYTKHSVYLNTKTRFKFVKKR